MKQTSLSFGADCDRANLQLRNVKKPRSLKHAWSDNLCGNQTGNIILTEPFVEDPLIENEKAPEKIAPVNRDVVKRMSKIAL